ncbi:MAG: ABC transporter substrate-binding protein [Eubacteriales bacterium]|nr:ABC transporter substrate-binding protein [Eubacteriales bacterium]
MKKIFLCAAVSSMILMGAVSANAMESNPPEIEGLTFQSEDELSYADEFRIYHYSDDFSLIDVNESGQYLLVPEGGTLPDNLPEDMHVLYKPLDTIYLAATSAMSLFDSCGALDSIALSGTDKDGWLIPNAVKKMEDGSIVYAGKYSEPDYELLLSGGCDLAIESTMILHSPKVQEMLENMGINVFIDRSSYETHPLGRTEWIKVYGELTGHQKDAADFFDKQTNILTDLKDHPDTDKTVVFFYLSTDGKAVVRAGSDYVPKMIELAGGKYVFDSLTNEESHKASVSLTMEEFYATAIDADYLIYNASIEEPITSTSELIEKNALFADFKAVKEGNVWCADKYFYQATDIIGEMIRDLNNMLTESNAEAMTFLHKVE